MSKGKLFGLDLVPPANFTKRYYTGRGHEYYQLFQGLPQLEQFYFNWEKEYNAETIFWFIVDNTWLVWFSICVYLLFIFGYPYVARRLGIGFISARKPIIVWNGLLAAFSWYGAIRVVPHFFYLLKVYDFDTVVCGQPEVLYGDGAVGFWIQAFILSKIAELIDTVFLVLRQKQPIFLHWYHHVTVLSFCFFTYAKENPGIIFCAMNYSVHAVMYTYYCAMAMRRVPKWFPTWIITLAQITQMVVGVFIAYSYYRIMSSGGYCAVSQDLLYACAIMYGSYLWLFVDFAIGRFLLGRTEEPAKRRPVPAAPAAGKKDV